MNSVTATLGMQINADLSLLSNTQKKGPLSHC